MSDAEERADEHRKTQHEIWVTCSNDGSDWPERTMQDQYNLAQPLCCKCLNDAPATLVDLIDRMDKYITDLEKNRDNFQVMAGKMSESLVLFAGMHEYHKIDDTIEEMKSLLEYQNKITKTLTRP